MTDDAAKEARCKKYGFWANFLSDAETEKIVHDYGDIAYLFKRIIENAFGKKYSYSVVDCEGEHLQGFFCRIYPKGNTHLDEMGVTFANPTTIMAEATLEYVGQLDCDFGDLLHEIYEESNNWDYGEDSPWELGLDSSEEEEDGGYVSCMLQITAYHGSDGHVFQDLPTVDDLDKYFERIKEVIDSHKKKTTKKGS
jgi:hypothetical protein